MKPMKTFLLRLPEDMNAQIDQIMDQTYCTKSQFIRQSILRNIDIIRNVEIPAVRAAAAQRIPKLF